MICLFEIELRTNNDLRMITIKKIKPVPAAPICESYKMGDTVFCYANGELIKTKIVRIYKGHVGVYAGDWVPYERSYSEVAKTLEQLMAQVKVKDYCVLAGRLLQHLGE